MMEMNICKFAVPVGCGQCTLSHQVELWHVYRYVAMVQVGFQCLAYHGGTLGTSNDANPTPPLHQIGPASVAGLAMDSPKPPGAHRLQATCPGPWPPAPSPPRRRFRRPPDPQRRPRRRVAEGPRTAESSGLPGGARSAPEFGWGFLSFFPDFRNIHKNPQTGKRQTNSSVVVAVVAVVVVAGSFLHFTSFSSPTSSAPSEQEEPSSAAPAQSLVSMSPRRARPVSRAQREPRAVASHCASIFHWRFRLNNWKISTWQLGLQSLRSSKKSMLLWLKRSGNWCRTSRSVPSFRSGLKSMDSWGSWQESEAKHHGPSFCRAFCVINLHLSSRVCAGLPLESCATWSLLAMQLREKSPKDVLLRKLFRTRLIVLSPLPIEPL